MTTLTFHNPGEIDIRGATIAGLSAKAGDSPIGFFGTGLKYSIACILRWGGKISIYSGETCHSFSAEALDFRGKDFQQIVMASDIPGRFARDSIPLGFTTEYGKTWEPWQVFRELYANARDESGDVTDQQVAPAPGRTTIIVDCPQLIEPFHARDSIIRPPTCHYDLVTASVKITNTPSAHIYYRDVRVRDQSTVLTYNVQRQLKLTEDRTLGWEAEHDMHSAIANAIAASTNRNIIWSFLNAPEGTMERDNVTGCFCTYMEFSEDFLDLATDAYCKAPSTNKWLEPILAKHRPKSVERQPITLTKVQQATLDRALGFLAQMGIDTTLYPVIVTDLGTKTMGSFHRPLQTVYISPECFRNGTKYLLSTLYEEFLHGITGKADCTYDLQTYLFDQIITLHEEHVFGEPI